MFITNREEEVKLANRIKELISTSAQLDMLVGFFYFSGIKVVEEPLQNNTDIKLRILVGMEIEKIGRSLVEYACGHNSKLNGDNSNEGVQQRFLNSLRSVVRHSSMDNKAFVDRLKTFVRLLENDQLEIRKTRNPNHAKLYIFSMDEEHRVLREKVWITGSSNFSLPGLNIRDELNVEISDFGTQEAQAYFDQLWDDAIPLNEVYGEIIRILTEESVATEITPYEAYYLVVKNYLEVQETKLDELRLDKLLKKAEMKRYTYQVDAVRLALARLKEHHGVIIADVVGLGKSIIASLVAALSNKNGIIIAPPALIGDEMRKDSGWYGYIDKFGLNGRWRAFSRGKMEDIREYVSKTPNIDMVIVDEAHWFRNENTDDYGDLSLICSSRDVVLLTATPFNNNPADLYALLKLFSPALSTNYVMGKNLDQLFGGFINRYNAYLHLDLAISEEDDEKIKKALKKCFIDEIRLPNGLQDTDEIKRILAEKRKDLAQKIKEVMEKVAIRRNRLDLLNDPDYAKEVNTLSEVQKPNEQFFELTDAQNDFYDSVILKYFGGENPEFTGAIYQPQNYKKDRMGDDAYQQNIYKMQLHSLVMRFESSFGSFRASLCNMQDMLGKVKEFIQKHHCFLYNRKAMKDIMEADKEQAGELLEKWVEELNKEYLENRTRQPIYYMDNSKFFVEQFNNDIDNDIKVIDKLISEVDKLNLANEDPKAAKLVEVVRQILNREHSDIKDGEDVKKRKVLIFSMYQDTISHLQSFLEKAFKKRVLCVTGGTLSNSLLKEIKENFDASVPTDKQADDYDILLATDKISEGHNLNRAGIVINYDIPWNPTRVIQRVGRINRIGKKVFDNLYIFNFYPTKKGSSITQNREIASTKMMAIHGILGEDACIFSAEEKPSASQLFQKLNEPLDNQGELSFYTRMKKIYREEMLTCLTEQERQRLDRLSPRVKTAMRKQPHGVFSFKRQGTSFFAIVSSPGESITEWTLEDAISAIQCSKGTKKVDHSGEFWSQGKQEGIYEKVVNYRPIEEGGKNSKYYNLAANVINQNIDKLDYSLRAFAEMVKEDLTTYGSLSVNKMKKISEIDVTKDPDAIKKLTKELEEIRDVKGEFYLDVIKEKALKDSIIVTIEQV